LTVNKSLLALAFLLILLTGSLEARPRTIVLSLLVPEDSPSPSNEGPYGSSSLFEALRGEGFRVAVAPQAGDIERLTFNGDLVALIVIGSEYFGDDAAEGLVEAARYLASEESGAGGVAVIVADERPGEAMLRFIEEASRALCGGPHLTIAPGSPGTLSTVTVLGPGGEAVSAAAGPAGFLAPLNGEVSAILASSPLSAARGEPARGSVGDVEVTVFAYAYPSPVDGSPVPVPAGAACRLGGNTLVLLSDSSVLLNGSPVNGDVGRILLSWAFPGAAPGEVTVLTVQEAYVGGGSRDVAVNVHPSLVMVALAQALPSVEEGLTASIRSVPLLALGFLASATLLLAALASGGREGLNTTVSRGEVNRVGLLKRVYKGARAGWLRAARLARLRLQGR